ncbi:MAG TPA: tetratricopeptide repeat protein [Mucilaginibacter sp.]|nr:tetratricopeptide repeat protein [Mucilaginibacter sp.]
MLKTKLSLLLLLAASCGAFGQATSAARPNSATMVQIINHKIDSVTQVIKITSDAGNLIRLYMMRGIAESALKHTDEAVGDFTKALSLHKPSNIFSAEIYLYRGDLYERTRNYQKCIDDYREALKFFGSNPSVASRLYTSIGYCQLQLKNYDEAVKADSIAMVNNPNSPFPEANMGFAYLHTRKYQQAADAFTAALYRYHTSNKKLLSDIVRARADAERKLKKNLDALNDYSMAINLDPDNRLAHWNKAACYNQNGDYQLADEEYTKAITYYKGDSLNLARLYDDRAVMELDEMKYAKSLQDDSIAMLYDSKYNEIYWHLPQAYAQNADFDKSVIAYNRALDVYRDNKNAVALIYDGIADEYYFLGKYDSVINACNQAIAINGQLWSSYLSRGRAYLKEDKKDLAMADFNKVASEDTAKGSYEYSFALFYIGQPDKAIQTMQSNIIATTNPALVVTHYYNLACLLSLMNKPDEAAAYLKKCIDKGYNKKYVLTDPDLENLRNSAQFKEAIGNN